MECRTGLYPIFVGRRGAIGALPLPNLRAGFLQVGVKAFRLGIGLHLKTGWFQTALAGALGDGEIHARIVKASISRNPLCTLGARANNVE